MVPSAIDRAEPRDDEEKKTLEGVADVDRIGPRGLRRGASDFSRVCPQGGFALNGKGE